jgi:UDP-glucose:(heptosyl)LPS alpha-1,3-glucosyltransferase
MLQKVAIITERSDVALGGAERSVTEVSQALSDLGLEVKLLAAKGASETPHVEVLCRHVPGKRVSFSAFGRALSQHLAEHRYDIIHSVLPFDFCDVYQPRGGTYAETLRRNAASYRDGTFRWFKKVTASINRRRTRLLNCERQLCRRPDGPTIAALSQYVVDQLREHYGTDPHRIALLLNGIRTEQQVDKEAVEELRNRIHYGLDCEEKDHHVLFLFAAHNFRLKGLGCLLEALSVAVQDVAASRVCLMVVGAGKTARYRRLARRLNVEDHIVFLGAVADIQNVLPLADVGILPTFYDPSSRFILEALAVGKPVITTRYNGAVDHFTDGRHGRIIDAPENVSALAEAIRYFADPHHITEASRAIAEDKLKERVSVHRVARDLVRLYESILERKGNA